MTSFGATGQDERGIIALLLGGGAEVRRGVELLALTGLAVTQPLLDVLGASPETFVFRGVDGWALVAFAAAMVVVPLAVAWLPGLLANLGGVRARQAVHVATVGALVGLAVLVGVRLAGWAAGPPALLLALATAGGAALAYQRVRPVRLFLLYLSPLPVLAALLFLFSSPVSGLVGGAEAEVAADVDGTRSVVMLVLDEFPTAAVLDGDGGIDAREYPNLARLGREATWFRNYTTHNASTVQAVPSLLSGDLPRRGAAPLVSDWPENLFTLLGGSYDMAVQETVSRLCPPDVCAGGPRSVSRAAAADEGLTGLLADTWATARQLVALRAEPEVATDAFAEEVVTIPAPTELAEEDRGQVSTQPTRFADFLAGMADGEDPTLHFLHLILPHGPWRFFPDGTEYASPEGDPEGQIAGVWTDQWPADLTRLRLELQARYTDALVGATMDRLAETGLWDDAVVVVVADHGGAFLEGQPGRALGEGNTTDVMWTPLFVRAPGLDPGPDDRDVEATDLLPTLAELLAVDLPYEVDGRSVLSDPDRSGEKRYQRIANPFQPEPDALLTIDTEATFARLLAEDWPDVALDDPVRSYYRAGPLGALIGQAPPSATDAGAPVGTASVNRLDALTEGTDGPLPAYLSGTVEAADLPPDPWVVVTLDGVVVAYSPLYPILGRDTAFSALFDQGTVTGDGHELGLFLAGGPDVALRPLTVTG